MLRVTALGVNHGDAILLEWAPEGECAVWRCLIDGGESEARLLQRLAAHGVNDLDLLVLSHLDTDHAGGLIGLAARVGIKAYWGPCLPAFDRHSWLFGARGRDAIARGRRLEETLRAQGVQILYPLEGFASAPLDSAGPVLHVLSPPPRLISRLLLNDDVVELVDVVPTPLGWLLTSTDDEVREDIQDLRIALSNSVLGPDDIPSASARQLEPRADAAELADRWARRTGAEPEFFGDSLLNNTSLVVWLEARTGPRLNRVLLPGDQENWTYLFARNPRGLQADILKLSHHGGRVYLEADEAENELFSMVRPEAVLVSATGRHGLPRSSVRQAAIRWNATVFCTSQRGREIVSALSGQDAPCCHDHFECHGNDDVSVSMTDEGIVGSKLACHTRQGGQPGPAILIRQHIVEPSHLVHKLFEGELRAHLEWLRRRLARIHSERRFSALPGGERSQPVSLAALQVAAADGRRDLAQDLPRMLEEGNRRGRFWAQRASYSPDSWQAYARPTAVELREYDELLDGRRLILFLAKGALRPSDSETLVLNLGPSGVALLVEQALGYPREIFRSEFWPSTVERMRRGKGWHCFRFKGVMINYSTYQFLGLTRHAGDPIALYEDLIASYKPLRDGPLLLPDSYSRLTDPVLVSGLDEEKFADSGAQSMVQAIFECDRGLEVDAGGKLKRQQRYSSPPKQVRSLKDLGENDRRVALQPIAETVETVW
jgi:beta-lactamase superfamily II metal-dependent hydrolase